MAPAPDSNGARPRRGITLLEVLISCALLVMGLSSIAALLPAAGSRMTQATTEDRAAVLLGNAAAEIANRRLAAADAFPAADSGSTLAFGAVLEHLPSLGALAPSGTPTAAEVFSSLSSGARKRCGSSRTFVLEDSLTYSPSQTSDTPKNAFTRDSSGLGSREFREGLCWGATLSPLTRPVAAGGKADLTIVIFKRGAENAASVGDVAVPLSLKRNGTVYEADGAMEDDDSLLRGCSWLLAIPADRATDSPRWFRILTSWNAPAAAGRKRRVVLHDMAGFAAFTGTSMPGTSATVLAFEGIVRVDEQAVTLE